MNGRVSRGRPSLFVAILLAASCQRPDQLGATPTAVTVIDAQGRPVRIADGTRLVTVGGAVTEIVFALGAGARVAGVDTSSTYPAAATRLPKVGYQRQLAAEGVLALRPTLVIVTADAGPPAAVQQLRASGTTVLEVTAEHTLGGARARIRTIAQALKEEELARTLLASLDRDITESHPPAGAGEPAPRVLFIYARGQGAVNVSGRGTAADEMIRLAGGRNALTEFEGYKPLTAEAAVAAAPDVVLIPAKGVDSLGGSDSVLRLPGLALTPAGKNRRVIAMDDLLLLGFGPRTGRAIGELASALYPRRTIGTSR